MRKILAATFMSLDGVMQAPGGPEEDPTGGFKYGGWQAGMWDDEVGAAIDETFAAPFDLLLGRRTYDIFAAYWPYTPTEPGTEGYDPGTAAIARAFNRVTKHVATHHPQSLGWANTAWLGEDPVSRLRTLKAEDGPTLLIQGSSVLIQTLLAHDLIDTFRLMVSPLVLGTGKKLFGAGTLPRTLEPVKSTTTRKGTLILDYGRGGTVPTGSFAMETPTEAELERRRALMWDA